LRFPYTKFRKFTDQEIGKTANNKVKTLFWSNLGPKLPVWVFELQIPRAPNPRNYRGKPVLHLEKCLEIIIRFLFGRGGVILISKNCNPKKYQKFCKTK
jgi:hypothetical protein